MAVDSAPLRLVVVAGLVALLGLMLLGGERGAAQPDAVAGVGRAGIVVELDELPRDSNGVAILGGLPGLEAAPEPTEESKQRLISLEAERDRVLDVRSSEPILDEIPPLPGDDEGPPRMDSGAPDPDRLDPKSVPAYLR